MQLNIRYKITFTIVSIIAVVLAGVYFYLNANLTSYTYDRIQESLKREIRLAESYFSSVYQPGSGITAIDRIADHLSKDLGLRVTIIDVEGKVLGDSKLSVEEVRRVENHMFRPEVQQSLKQGFGLSRRFSSTIQQDLIYAAVLVDTEDFSGVLRLAISLSEVGQVSSNLRELLIVSLMMAFVLSLLFSFVASSFISNPIKDVSHIARSIAEGDFSKKLIIDSKDEIEDLSRSLNYMSEQIKSRIEEVTSSKSRLEAVFLSMIEGVMVIDANGTIILMNQILKEFLRIEADPIGRKPLEIIRNIEIHEMVDNVLKLQSGIQSQELSVLIPEEKTLLIHATPVIRNESIDGAVLIFHDITELRQLEKIRQDFVANVSHELRTPISTIKGYAETLLSGALDDKENAEDFLRIIYSDSDRLAKLINDLLDLSRIESGKLNISLTDVDLVKVVDRVVVALLSQIEAKGVKIHFEPEQKTARVKMDENSAAQIFLNLIENAVKYNKENGDVFIDLKEENDFITVTVRDTGLGIPEEDLPRIFERFYRVDKAHSREIGGTGLGLSIVKHLVQANHGLISVESILHKGTTFYVKLPLIPA